MADHGEVFTAEQEVKAMCDFVVTKCDNVDATFLEPACGDGNFLSETLDRKLKRVKKDAKNNHIMWEWLSIAMQAMLWNFSR